MPKAYRDPTGDIATSRARKDDIIRRRKFVAAVQSIAWLLGWHVRILFIQQGGDKHDS